MLFFQTFKGILCFCATLVFCLKCYILQYFFRYVVRAAFDLCYLCVFPVFQWSVYGLSLSVKVFPWFCFVFNIFIVFSWNVCFAAGFISLLSNLFLVDFLCCDYCCMAIYRSSSADWSRRDLCEVGIENFVFSSRSNTSSEQIKNVLFCFC